MTIYFASVAIAALLVLVAGAVRFAAYLYPKDDPRRDEMRGEGQRPGLSAAQLAGWRLELLGRALGDAPAARLSVVRWPTSVSNGHHWTNMMIYSGNFGMACASVWVAARWAITKESPMPGEELMLPGILGGSLAFGVESFHRWWRGPRVQEAETS